MRRRPANREDRGATAITIAISMLLLMGFAAITIDGGLAYGDRRVLASAADTGALAALQFARPSLIGGASVCGAGSLEDQAACRGAEEAMEVVLGTLSDRFDDAAWWACLDPNKPAEFTIDATVTNPIPCISFTENFSKSRVKMPDTDLPTTFGRLIGFNSIRTGAAAEVELVSLATADILPNSPTNPPGPELCLFSNQAPQSVFPCDGSISGFSGYVDLALHGITEPPITCEQGNSNLRIAINTAKGSDHDLFTFPPVPIVNDHASCPVGSEHINEVVVQPGNPSISSITQGLITGVSGQINGQSFAPSPGRVACTLGDPDCANVRGVGLDDVGLWDFLDLMGTPPGDCNPAPTDYAGMAICLAIPSNALFLDTIEDHPRFAAVPILNPAPTGPGSYEIRIFEAVWIETLYFGCNAIRCETIHSPGEFPALGGDDCPDFLTNAENVKSCGWSETGSINVEGMLAFAIPLDSLPPDIRNTFPGTSGVHGFFLSK